MSLSWDVRKVPEELYAEGEPWNVTQAIIFATMVIGLNEITEKSVRTFIERMDAYQRVGGALMTHYDGKEMRDRPITAEEIRARIGLWTNASMMTDAAFVKNMGRILMERVQEANKQR